MPVGLPLTTADLDLMPDDGHRYELLEGELIVSRAPSLSHQRISGNIFAALTDHLREHPNGEVFTTPGIVFGAFDSVIPDLVWVSEARLSQIVQDDRFVAAPELVIEIVSPGEANARHDRVNKRHIYGRWGVLEYWVVDPAQYTVERYVLADDVLHLRATAQLGEDIVSDVLPAFRCSVAPIWRTLLMAAQPRMAMTVEEYLAFERTSEDRHEFDGVKITTSPGGTERHSLISGGVLAALHFQLRRRNCVVFNINMRVHIPQTGLYTYPDVSALCSEAMFRDSVRDTLLNPSVTVEVLSPSTEKYDRGTK